jgi:soluble lytic murein transglycosylase-like protein
MTARPSAIAPATVDPAIVGDIKRASQSAHVDFAYMVATAAQESGFQPDAKASTSNATGLYQFIDSTWLNSVKMWGPKYGLGQYASQIQTGAGGQATVADPALRQRILDLRKDPAVSASLAAELASSNKAEVEHALGRSASPTDLYLAHFLGAQGATEFVRKIETDGQAKAADLMPAAAAANRAVFYDDNGQAKTVSQIYANFSQRLERQVSEYANATGVSSFAASEALALDADEPSSDAGPPLLATMNVLSLAALKLLGRRDQQPDRDQTETTNRHKADTSA